MKIEKINDSQIRCTLTRTDLQSRELKISELAYGTEKAKNLFQDMIEQASTQFGFETDDLPLMIEAIPVSPDCIILNITKVEDPEELDTRFSKFAPADEDSSFNDNAGQDLDYDDIFPESQPVKDEDVEFFENILQKVSDFIPMKETLASIKSGIQTDTECGGADENLNHNHADEDVTRLFSFTSYSAASKAAKGIIGDAIYESSLYKDTAKGIYYLFMLGHGPDCEDFLKVCNQLVEYGRKETVSYSTASYLKEHCEPIIKKNAVSILRSY